MSDLIIRVLTEPKALVDLNIPGWDLLIRQARCANLLGRLSIAISDYEQAGQDAKAHPELIPTPVRNHLFSGDALAQRQEMAIRWEVACLKVAMKDIGLPLVLLKGAAYVLADLPAARGRVFSDVDILVPKKAIGDAEGTLMMHGWHTGQYSAYDDKYYRKWMHEIPPMTHMKRGTVIDVHHAILPDTARIKTNAAKLLGAVVPVAKGVYVLAPVDMLLHSATHLFHEGELHNGLRDLFDLDGLLRHFGAQAGFWDTLVPRAIELGLTRPLYYALRYTMRMLDTPVPGAVTAAVGIGRPFFIVRALMDFCYLRALRPHHVSCSDAWTALARKMLYVRSHWIRMPFHLLVVHLTRKAFFKEAVETPDAPDAVAIKAKAGH